MRLFGRDYSIRGHGNRAYLEKLAVFIETRADEIREKSHISSALDLAVLTLLSVADELFQTERGDSTKRQEPEETTEQQDNIV
ncbi:MAG: cell division protein ZapA [Thermodesulfobacteriota bacterium]